MRIEEAVGERLRELRQTHRLSQVQLGDRLSRPWSRQAVSAAEQGRRSFTVAELVELSKALGVSVADLIVGIDKKPSTDYVDRHATLDALRQMRRRLDDLIDELCSQL